MGKDIARWAMAKAMTIYIDFVYRTSSVGLLGYDSVLRDPEAEKMIALFWHGDSFCLYPALKGLNLYIVVTKDRRGDYIADVCHHYGYHTLRLPDASDGGNHLFRIRRTIAGEKSANIALTLDGPIGVYHVPQDFPFVVAALTRRKLMPIEAEVKRTIRLWKRWDKFKIPLPFNEIKIHFNEPVQIARGEEKDPFGRVKMEIVQVMEKHETTNKQQKKG